MDWIVTEVDGKVASIATDYRHLPHIAGEIAKLPAEETFSLGTRKISTGELLEYAEYLTWEDLRLFGTPFQLKVWEALFRLPRRLYRAVLRLLSPLM
jgi:O6-methylguanine-DNA--protein-cysteine methyltransferase